MWREMSFYPAVIGLWLALLIGVAVASQDAYTDNLIRSAAPVSMEAIFSVQKDIDHYLRKGFLRAERIRTERRKTVTKDRNIYGTYRVPYLVQMKRAEAETQIASSCEGLGMLETSRIIAESQNWTKEEIPSGLAQLEVSETLLAELTSSCSRNPVTRYAPQGNTYYYPRPSGKCLKNKYRSIDGTCNNANHFEWGSARQPFNRLLGPDYGDNIGSPRDAGGRLPNPRSVSLAISGTRGPAKSRRVTQMLKLWGQFTDHDLTFTPEAADGIGEDKKPLDIECCDDGRKLESPNLTPRDCLPIKIPREDNFFRQFKVKCLRFVRSTPFSTGNKLHAREQVNELTPFIDGSNVYGSSVTQMNELREFKGGRLRVGAKRKPCPRSCPLSLLPENVNDPDEYFLAGDSRVNEQPSLASMHTIWLRFHNILAEKILAQRQASDEIVFQEARRIVGAIMQHITYTEFLPVVLGTAAMEHYKIITPNRKFFDGNRFNTFYDVKIQPSIFNVFGAAAFRFGHTLVSGDMSGSVPFLLAENFNRGELLTEPGTSPSEILSSEAFTAAQNVDPLVDSALRNQLFATEQVGFTHGSDLLSLNIMRGRDHGIRSYNHWRRVCRLPTFDTIHDMSREHDLQAVHAYLKLYEDVNDIDLFPALLSETVSEFSTQKDGILGPTMRCLIAEQFFTLKYGDRFWYENGDDIQIYSPRASFEAAQLDIIRETSLAYVLCQTAAITTVPERPMELSGIAAPFGAENPIIRCDREDWNYPNMLLPSLEFGDWWRRASPFP